MHDDTLSLEDRLADLCFGHLIGLEDFAGAEARAHEDVLAVLSRAMSRALDRFDERLFAERPGEWRVKDRRERSILTEFGLVTYSRRIYIDEFGDRRTWLDEILSLRPGKRLSPGAQHALCLFGSEIPYGRASKTLFRHIPHAVSAMTTMSALRETGDLLETEALLARTELFSKGISPKAAHKTADIFIEADSVFIPLARKKDKTVEIKALCAYAGKRDGERVGCVHHALSGPSKRFWQEGVARIGQRYSLPAIKRCFAGTDGEAWCKALPDYLHGPKIVHKLDPWHVVKAIKTAFPKEEECAPLFDVLKEQGAEALLAALRLRLDTGYGDRKKTRTLLTYIENNKEAIVKAAPSMGTMEGTNAHLYAARMKVWGGAWSKEGASDMARIRARIHSGETLPVPKREQDFGEKDRKRREALRDKLRYEFKYEMVLSDGKGYEPRGGHLMPFSTRQTYLAMFDPRNRG